MIHINNKNINLEQNTVVCLGNFDGVHIGHQTLIKEVEKCALENNLRSVVFSFEPHPASVMNNIELDIILTNDEMIDTISNYNIDFFVQYPFDIEFSKLTAEEFLEKYIKKQLKSKIIVIGEDYKVGSDQYNSTQFKDLCNLHSIEVLILPLYKIDNIKVSSSRIRSLILENKFEDIEMLLNKPYFITSIVLQGKKIGRTIGFPTINFLADKHKILPQNGVYCTKTYINGSMYSSITNIGVNPTVSRENIKKVETFIFSLDEELYNETATVYFYKFIRAEMKFNNLDELKLQIGRDIDYAKKFANNKK